jgi:hypothetical protein
MIISITLLYLDLGSGSLILQAIIAGFLGVAMFFKNIKMYILHLFKKDKKDAESTISEDKN